MKEISPLYLKALNTNPRQKDETHILMFEPKETLNTGSAQGPLTVQNPQII